ncbi:MAG: hypothetical protein KUG77_28395 [Nannocystaceae bacterium]|nr:hypothetical protein [Nannocystaceae bacterium]
MWSIEAGPGRILIRPTGYLSIEESAVAADDFERALRELDGSCVLIVDLSSLTGYDSEVRRIWQETMRCSRAMFSSIIWVSDKPLFRMVAASVSLFTGIPGRVVGSHEDPLQFAV